MEGEELQVIEEGDVEDWLKVKAVHECHAIYNYRSEQRLVSGCRHLAWWLDHLPFNLWFEPLLRNCVVSSTHFKSEGSESGQL